jgi:hypothetical protein
MPGGGNHRGSVFRLHVGTSLLTSGHWPDSIRASWAMGSSASRHVRRVEFYGLVTGDFVRDLTAFLNRVE